ncbi:putative inhibitor of apoptosis [Aplysia californica]|uniref:Inhibitor of apoptosis n=1 Tax=Aplysia californica TaxID=6500 RepID=A0ABM1W1P0_APLCA|nr:putative inhibitor of apoptosis [Aplysia californica]XP_035828582.1 putative inhibitor of apoptosis [Aplysia californica]XP_035828583.1 putative inhibitor of apoptosis [Aplysia californica]
MDSMIDTSFSNELIRFGTFVGWPGSDIHCKSVKPSAIDLAKTGFYFTGSSDEVCCFACGLVVKDWERHHDPIVVHATRSPRCPMVLGRDHSNSPVIVPEDAERLAILSMLQQASQRVLTAVSGSYTSSSLLANTLTVLYGETMMRARPPQMVAPSACSLTSSPRQSPSTVRQNSRDPPSSPGGGGRMQASRPAATASSDSPQRRSSASDSESTAVSPRRPQFQRTRSYAMDSRPSSNSETIANRQNSNPSTDHVEYQESEEARLATFNSWPGIRGATAREFAQAGFIFYGAPDRVQCVFCNGLLRNWNDNDRPIEEHRKHFPTCSFVTECLSAITVAQPRHTNYRTLESREKSFLNWSRRTQTPVPEALASAGFFYVGHGDNVKCFFCDGGLRNWEPNDDPWREHARWFPKCDYVRQIKGPAYIEAVLGETNLTEYQTASVDNTDVKNVAGLAAPRDMDPREVTARLDSEIVKAVLKMDVPKDLVRKAIRKRLAEDSDDFSSAEALLEAVFNLDPNEPSLQDPAEGHGLDGLLGSSSPPSDSSNAQESLRLMEENRLLKEQKQCKICMDEEVCMAFLPCGHLVCCATCAPALDSCPICRGKIKRTVRTYMA